jgi:hypothetical protein
MKTALPFHSQSTASGLPRTFGRRHAVGTSCLFCRPYNHSCNRSIWKETRKRCLPLDSMVSVTCRMCSRRGRSDCFCKQSHPHQIQYLTPRPNFAFYTCVFSYHRAFPVDALPWKVEEGHANLTIYPFRSERERRPDTGPIDSTTMSLCYSVIEFVSGVVFSQGSCSLTEMWVNCAVSSMTASFSGLAMR